MQLACSSLMIDIPLGVIAMLSGRLLPRRPGNGMTRSWRLKRRERDLRKLAAILVSRRCRLFAACRGRRGSISREALRAPSASDLIDPHDLRAPWPHRQAHRRRQRHRVSQRRRRSTLRPRSAARHGRAQCGGRARKAHRISHRHSFGRCCRGKRRRPDGRRRQYRCEAGGHRRTGGDLPVRGRLSAGQGSA